MIKQEKKQTTMDYKKYIQMIDEYIQEPNNINREWVECLTVCRGLLEMKIPKKKSNTNHDRTKKMSIVHYDGELLKGELENDRS